MSTPPSFLLRKKSTSPRKGRRDGICFFACLSLLHKVSEYVRVRAQGKPGELRRIYIERVEGALAFGRPADA